MSKFSFTSKPTDKPKLSMSAQPAAPVQITIQPQAQPQVIVFDKEANKKEAKRLEEEKQKQEIELKRQKIRADEEAKKNKTVTDQQAQQDKAKKEEEDKLAEASKIAEAKLAAEKSQVSSKPALAKSSVAQKSRPVETKEERDKRLELFAAAETAQRESMKAEKEKQKPLSVIFSGHVDHGKSSMSGHILVNTGQIDDRSLQKLKQEAAKTVGESWGYAFALDACQEEREKGKTVESARATFTTSSGRRVVLLDSPGHKGFISSMIESAAQADVGVLVTSARKGEFEAGLEKSGQTSEHGLILYISGVKNLIIAVNKMDDPTCQYSQERFEQIRQGLTTYLTKTVGYQEKNLTFVPVSALTGENLTTKLTSDSSMSKWYNGPCLVDLIDEVKIPKRDIGGFTRACVSGKYRDQGFFVVAKVEKGQLRKGDKYLLMPQFEEIQVMNIEDEVGNQIDVAAAGENCRIQIEEKQFDQVQDGCVLCDRTHQCETSKTFVVKFLCVECPNVVTQGFQAIMHVNTCVSPCKVKSILGILDPKTGKIDKTAPKTFVKAGQSALVEFECDKEICVNKFDLESFLGRVLVRHELTTVGIGQIVKICYE